MNNYIITGDFNCHSDHDKQEPSAKIFLNIIEANNLFDVEKTFYPEPRHTFYHKALRQTSRIDYILASENLRCIIK